MIGADPVGSIYSDDEVHPYLVEGVGEDFWPATFDPSVVDRYVTVSDRDSFLTTRRLAATGGHARRRLVRARRCTRRSRSRAEIDDPSAMIAVILPDGGRAYLSKIFNDAWMTAVRLPRARREDRTVGDVLRAKQRRGEIPPFVTVQTHQKVRDAIALLHEHRVSQLPVVSAHDDRRRSSASIGERGLLKRAVDGPATCSAPRSST